MGGRLAVDREVEVDLYAVCVVPILVEGEWLEREAQSCTLSIAGEAVRDADISKRTRHVGNADIGAGEPERAILQRPNAHRYRVMDPVVGADTHAPVGVYVCTRASEEDIQDLGILFVGVDHTVPARLKRVQHGAGDRDRGCMARLERSSKPCGRVVGINGNVEFYDV